MDIILHKLDQIREDLKAIRFLLEPKCPTVWIYPTKDVDWTYTESPDSVTNTKVWYYPDGGFIGTIPDPPYGVPNNPTAGGYWYPDYDQSH